MSDEADLADLVSRFADAAREAWQPVGVDRAARFTQAVVVVAPSTPAELDRCALATLVPIPDDIAVLERVFRTVFEGVTVVAVQGAEDRRLAYRVVSVNPRAAEPSYQPLAQSMAAALPHCDAVAGADRLSTVDELIRAIGAQPCQTP